MEPYGNIIKMETIKQMDDVKSRYWDFEEEKKVRTSINLDYKKK